MKFVRVRTRQHSPAGFENDISQGWGRWHRIVAVIGGFVEVKCGKTFNTTESPSVFRNSAKIDLCGVCESIHRAEGHHRKRRR